jgi:Domain of unknown function (DUF3597)
MAAGWNVRVTTFDSKGKPGIVRNFLAYEADKQRAIELVRKRVPVNKGEEAEAVAERTYRRKDEAWRCKAARSIVDLMKVLDLDSSLSARKHLTQELHYTGDTTIRQP